MTWIVDTVKGEKRFLLLRLYSSEHRQWPVSEYQTQI